MLISVTIASIGRPDLSDTLRSLDHLTLQDGVDVEIILGDDSPEGKARAVAEGIQLHSADLTIVDVGSRNIATCRNACLDKAKGEWIAFIDDDERADPDWLTNMLAAAHMAKADAVFGKIISTYPDEVPSWFLKADPVGRLREKADGPVKTGSSGNAMVRREVLEAHGLRFDPAFGRTGGEDTDFFSRLFEAGGTLVFTNAAIVREEVPAGKATVAFSKLRALRSGQTYARQTLRQTGGLHRVVFFADAFLKMTIAEGLALITYPFDRSEAFIFRLRALMNRGKLREFLQMPLIELYRSKALDV